jgi:hypothetical protein
MRPTSFVATLFLIAVQAGILAQAEKPAPPYPQSKQILDIEWDFESIVTLAPGSDNWPITWPDDDKQYTSWGDGGGFGGTNQEGRVSLGFASVEGSSGRYQGRNISFYFAPKWWPEDAREFTLVYTNDDHWSTIKGAFLLATSDSAEDH